MTERESITATPLSWPKGRQRRNVRSRARFRASSVFREAQFVMGELHRMDARGIIVSTNLLLRKDGIPYSGQRAPADPGVAVWFTLKAVQHVLCCDAWDRVEDNLRAVGKHVEALRGQDRWGVGTLEEAFAGFRALPERVDTDWRAVLGILADVPLSRVVVEERFRELAFAAHPDRGGSHDRMAALTAARVAALEEVKRSG